ncbi:hypothetical protein HPB51_000735 [Rhipicephalus microplus]|uniref:Uncharacterized protein n=1 Tax=Rhipicephalus microplus TaxID=6941 RepID=A0A9J6EVS8_RHIMP|nr:hypothetical protein HPB51_000735 [Rhipicephalus microplus]
MDPLLRVNESASRKLVRSLLSLASVPFLHVAASRAVSIFMLSSFLLTAVDFGTDNGLAGYKAVALVTASAIGDLVSRVGTGLLLDTKVSSVHECFSHCAHPKRNRQRALQIPIDY